MLHHHSCIWQFYIKAALWSGVRSCFVSLVLLPPLSNILTTMHQSSYYLEWLFARMQFVLWLYPSRLLYSQLPEILLWVSSLRNLFRQNFISSLLRLTSNSQGSEWGCKTTMGCVLTVVKCVRISWHAIDYYIVEARSWLIFSWTRGTSAVKWCDTSEEFRKRMSCNLFAGVSVVATISPLGLNSLITTVQLSVTRGMRLQCLSKTWAWLTLSFYIN